MNKDTNIRVFPTDAKLLAKLAKSEGRTMKMMFSIAVKNLDIHLYETKN